MENSECFYCGKVAESDDNFYKHRMYQVYKVTKFPIGYKFNTKDIFIPRCKSCRSKHDKSWIIVFLPSFLIASPALFYMLYVTVGDWPIFGALLLSLFLALFVGSGIAYVADKVFFKLIFNLPRETDIKEYSEIKELLDLGWHFYKPDPGGTSKYDIAKDSPHYME